MSKKTVYAWDATVLLAWLEEDQNAPLGGIDSVVQERFFTPEEIRELLALAAGLAA